MPTTHAELNNYLSFLQMTLFTLNRFYTLNSKLSSIRKDACNKQLK